MSVAAFRYGYFPSSGAAGITVTPDGYWDDTSASDAVIGQWDSPSGSSFLTESRVWNWSGAINIQHKVLARQYILPAFGSMGFQSPSVGPALIPGSTPTGMPLNPIARMRVASVTLSGSPVPSSNWSVQSRMVVKVVDGTTGALKFVILRNLTGDNPPYPTGSSSVLTAKRWVIGSYVDSTSLPATTDRLVYELGFRLQINNNTHPSYVYTVEVEFGDADSSYLTLGATAQHNPGFCLLYYVNASAVSGGGPTILKPVAPTITPMRFQYPVVPDMVGDSLNELILN